MSPLTRRARIGIFAWHDVQIGQPSRVDAPDGPCLPHERTHMLFARRGFIRRLRERQCASLFPLRNYAEHSHANTHRLGERERRYSGNRDPEHYQQPGRIIRVLRTCCGDDPSASQRKPRNVVGHCKENLDQPIGLGFRLHFRGGAGGVARSPRFRNEVDSEIVHHWPLLARPPPENPAALSCSGSLPICTPRVQRPVEVLVAQPRARADSD